MPDTKALQKMEAGGMARPEPDPRGNVDIGELLRYAVDKGVTTDAMNGLMAIRRELNAEAAKKAFDEAMAQFQSVCPVIEKRKAVMNKDGRSIRYKYAPLDDIVTQVKEPLKANGFSYTLNAEVKGNMVKAICRIKHCAGHEQFSEMEVPIDPDAYMNGPQKYASALTFAKRYAFCNGFGILTGDEDTDGATKKPQQPGPSALQGSTAPTANDKANKQKLVDLTRGIHFATGYALDDIAKGKLTQWLIDEAFISDTQTVTDLAGAELAKVVEKVQAKLRP